ncbi:PEP-CTERM sorting domain-containing protein [Bremerella cremea]|nr:PEP-CTERM sorting domain-containing protein [Bremerella cremea]
MRRKWLSVLAVLVGLSLVTARTEAGMIAYDLDLQDAGGSMVTGTSSLAPPVSVAVGETLTLETSFFPDQHLKINGAGSTESLFLGLSENSTAFSSISDVTVTLLGFSGTNGASNTYIATLATSPGYGNMLGVVLSDFLNDDQIISFTGYKVEFKVNSLNPSPHSYQYGTLMATSAVVAVPEPSTYAMFGIGVLALGLGMFWKSRRQGEIAVA